MTLIQNPLVLGLIVFVVVWLIRRLKWPVEGPKAIWLTYMVALGIGVAEKVFLEGFPSVVTCALVPGNPPAFALCVAEILTNVLAFTGVIFGVTTGIYKVLRHKMLLGDRV